MKIEFFSSLSLSRCILYLMLQSQNNTEEGNSSNFLHKQIYQISWCMVVVHIFQVSVDVPHAKLARFFSSLHLMLIIGCLQLQLTIKIIILLLLHCGLKAASANTESHLHRFAGRCQQPNKQPTNRQRQTFKHVGSQNTHVFLCLLCTCFPSFVAIFLFHLYLGAFVFFVSFFSAVIISFYFLFRSFCHHNIERRHSSSSRKKPPYKMKRQKI